MQKPVLGRKLESLMSQPPGQGGATNQPQNADSSGQGSPGVSSLIRGNRLESPLPVSQPRSGWRGIPRWYLLGADLVLVAMALLIAFTSPSPLGWKKELFCVLAVATGGGLAVLALGSAKK